jgi:hypothetical protein
VDPSEVAEGEVEKRFCREEVDARSSRGREYLVVLRALDRERLLQRKRTSRTMAITRATARMAPMIPPAMAPPFTVGLFETLPVVLPVGGTRLY